MQIFDSWTSWPQAQQDLRTHLSKDILEALDQAFLFATACHKQQTRPDGTPYIVHLLEVIEILVEGVGIVDKDLLLTGVLHDVIEDTSCSVEEIQKRFGPHVANLVEWLTKPVPRQGEDSKQVKASYFAQLTRAPREAIIVKLADRLSNVQKLNTHPRLEKQKSYYQETVEKIIPLAQDVSWFDTQFQIWEEKFSYLAE